MPYSRESVPPGHTQFGGGPGMVDPMVREDRVLEPHQEVWEIYATNPAAPAAARGDTPEERTARAEEIAIENDPTKARIERPTAADIAAA